MTGFFRVANIALGSALGSVLVLTAACGDDGDVAESTTGTGPGMTATVGPGTATSGETSGTATADASATATTATTTATTGSTTAATGSTTATTTDATATTDATTTATTTDATATTDATTTAGTTAGDPGNLEALLDEGLWEAMFPERNALFTYEALLAAAADFPSFAGEGDADARRRELAAFLANIGHETTGGWADAPGGPYAWGLYFKEEVGCEMGDCVGYCDPNNVTYPCAPMQLSWNYNYGQAGEALGMPLLTDPDLVANDGTTSFATALWFWMTPQSPKPSAHDVMVGAWTPSDDDLSKGRAPGFGMTINIINGGLECGKPTPPQVEDRLGFFARMTELLGVDVGENVLCESMQPYG